MPLYSFENTKTGKEWSEMMTISDKEEYLKNNMSYRQDQGWKENLSRIAEAHPKSALAKEHGKRSIKEVRTERVINKHRKIQAEKAKKFAK